MGDRISISFVNNRWSESPALFSHWDGKTLLESVSIYLYELHAEIEKGLVSRSYPLGRLEPNTVMVDFIVWYYKKSNFVNRVTSNYYLGKDQNDGDNSDNGHFKFHLDRPLGFWLSG